MMRVALILFLACAVAAHAAAGERVPRRALQQLGVDRVRRLDGSGVAGARITELLANINQLAQGACSRNCCHCSKHTPCAILTLTFLLFTYSRHTVVPRIGSNATVSTASDGAQEGATQTRGATVQLRTLPLATGGNAGGTVGNTAQTVSGTGSTSVSSNSTSVAKDIVNDGKGEEPVRLWQSAATLPTLLTCQLFTGLPVRLMHGLQLTTPALLYTCVCCLSVRRRPRKLWLLCNRRGLHRDLLDGLRRWRCIHDKCDSKHYCWREGAAQAAKGRHLP